MVLPNTLPDMLRLQNMYAQLLPLALPAPPIPGVGGYDPGYSGGIPSMPGMGMPGMGMPGMPGMPGYGMPSMAGY